MTTAYHYVGSELELFAHATRWKAYFRAAMAPYLGRDVLEVGAGLGGSTRLLCRGTERRWVCLEPDPALADRLAVAIGDGSLPACCRLAVGTIAEAAALGPFDTVLYIDVLEHIADDRGELARAADILAPGGHVVALAPAHNWLYSPFDRAIGHHRRYSRRSLRALTPEALELVRLAYLDSAGLLASLGNRLLLRSPMPTAAQVRLWDRVLVRLSRRLDPLLAHRLGKSVLGAWRKRPAGPGRVPVGMARDLKSQTY